MKWSRSKRNEGASACQPRADDTLVQRLRLATRDDLKALLETDLRVARDRYRGASYEELVAAVSKELRSAAGHSLLNLWRQSHELPYKRILIDVADKLAPGRFKWSRFTVDGPESEREIEDYINERFQLLVEQYLKSLDESDKVELQKRVEADLRAQGLPANVVASSMAALATGTISGVLIGPIVAAALFGSFWTWLFGLSVGQLVLGGIAGGGPVGILVAAAIIATGTSYSKTIPAVTRLIVIRRDREAKDRLKMR